MTVQSEPKFKIGDKVQMTQQTSENFKTIPLEPWTVLKVRNGGIITVQRSRRKGGVRTDTWHQDLLEIVSTPKIQVFSEAQEIALRELIRKVVQEMDTEGFFNHDYERGAKQ